MPIHNWSHVSDGMFHWFHQRWIGTIADWLNQSRLPEGFYAIGEVYANEVEPDVLAVEDRSPDLESPPKTRFTWEAETESYLAKKDLIAVRSVEGILVAVIEIVSAGNKSSQARFRKFLTKTIEFLAQGLLRCCPLPGCHGQPGQHQRHLWLRRRQVGRALLPEQRHHLARRRCPPHQG